MAPASSAQASAVMVSADHQRPAETALPAVNVEFVKLFEGSKKLKNASFQAHKRSLRDRQLKRRCENKRGVLIIAFGPLCVLGPHGTTWHTDVGAGTSHAMAFADRFDALHPHPDALKNSLRYFHPLYIDRLWHMIHLDWYSMRLPRRLEFVDQASQSEYLCRDMIHKSSVELHLWMAVLAETVRYPDLKIFALGEVQKALVKHEVLNISVFGVLILQLFGPGAHEIKDEDRSLRLVMATYGAFCDPLWRQQQAELHKLLTEDNGPTSYGCWHQKALAALPGARERELPDKILRLLDANVSSDSTSQAKTINNVQARKSINIISRVQRTAPPRVQMAATRAGNQSGASMRRQRKIETRSQRKAQMGSRESSNNQRDDDATDDTDEDTVSKDASDDLQTGDISNDDEADDAGSNENTDDDADDADDNEGSTDVANNSKKPSPGVEAENKATQNEQDDTGSDLDQEPKGKDAKKSHSTTKLLPKATSSESKVTRTNTGSASTSIKVMPKSSDTTLVRFKDIPASTKATSGGIGAASSSVGPASPNIKAMSVKTKSTQASSGTQRTNKNKTTPESVPAQKVTDSIGEIKKGVMSQKGVVEECAIETNMECDMPMGVD